MVFPKNRFIGERSETSLLFNRRFQKFGNFPGTSDWKVERGCSLNHRDISEGAGCLKNQKVRIGCSLTTRIYAGGSLRRKERPTQQPLGMKKR